MNDSEHDRSPSCCAPTRPTDLTAPAVRPDLPTDAPRASPVAAVVQVPVPVPAGEFEMGDPFGEGYPGDGETPLHHVVLRSFAVDPTAVTNQEFTAFVADTGYRTDAERYGSSAVFHLAVRADDADILGRATGAPWWLEVRGASWQHPDGPASGIDDRLDHPVVHVSHADAEAYCHWAGKRLLTEAEWEYASRAGHAARRFPWGDELTPGGAHLCNIWQGTFPTQNTLGDRYLTTAPAQSFYRNDFGLWSTAGNVWEWCSDWFSPYYYKHSPTDNPSGPPFGEGRVMRGGSYLCHSSYCHRYRVSARSANIPESSSGNLGFRCAMDID